MNDKYRIFGGPLDGAEVEAGFVLGNVFDAPLDFKNYKPMPEEESTPYWKIAATRAEAEFMAKYRLEGGRLVFESMRKCA